jgi:ATP-dependent 26S proteasome regulatory subunit
MNRHLSAPPIHHLSDLHQDCLQQLDLMMRARYPVVYVVAVEEEPVEVVLQQVAERSQPQRTLIMWDVVQGWSDTGADKGSLMGALSRVGRTAGDDAMLFVLRDVHPFLRSPVSDRTLPIIRAIKNLARQLQQSRSTLILLSHTLVLPPELMEEVSILDFSLPYVDEIDLLIKQRVVPESLNLTQLAREQLVKACQGLSRTRIHRILARAIAAKGEVNEADILSVLDEKKAAIRQTGILEFFTAHESLKRVGGLDNLKQWVQMRQDVFTEEARRYGIPNPKGVLLVGIQGTGKSLSAKTIAHEWRLPLLRLDVGRLFGGLVGESESRMRQMIQIVEAIAPCVLWIDEIDKAFGNIASGADGDSGTSRRVFGSLITWMQEKTSPVFIVATANNVQILPAELLRKGRFDEIFFLNLPTEQEREDIFRVHLQKLRPSRIRDFDLTLLAKQTKNFSGAEIEQVIIDGMHLAFGRGIPGDRQDFTTEDIIQAIEETVPLAAISRQQIELLKRWAANAGARSASRDSSLLEELQHYLRGSE